MGARGSKVPIACALLTVSVTGAEATAAGATTVAAPPPARLYTNADLERFGPSHPRAAPPEAFDEAGAWQFVSDFLERQRIALEAEQKLRLERQAIEAVGAGPERCRRRYVAPFAGVFGSTLVALPFRFPRLDAAPAPRPAPSATSPHRSPFDPRAFMSARPTLSAGPTPRSR